jgi:hypothetical protein
MVTEQVEEAEATEEATKGHAEAKSDATNRSLPPVQSRCSLPEGVIQLTHWFALNVTSANT